MDRRIKIQLWEFGIVWTGKKIIRWVRRYTGGDPQTLYVIGRMSGMDRTTYFKFESCMWSSITSFRIRFKSKIVKLISNFTCSDYRSNKTIIQNWLIFKTLRFVGIQIIFEFSIGWFSHDCSIGLDSFSNIIFIMHWSFKHENYRDDVVYNV